MPGYRSLADTVIGDAANFVRAAGLMVVDERPTATAQLLEEALRISREHSSVIPDWLAGRLAAAYRTLRRFDDEVALLECYRDSQTCEQQRVRYDARLSKARAIAAQKTKRSSGALESVHRVVSGRPLRKPFNGRLFDDEPAGVSPQTCLTTL